MKTTTLKMEILLMHYFDITANLIVPGVTTMSQMVEFETDLLVLSKAGYATAVEIKVSKDDLRNDLKKRHIKKVNQILINGKFGLDFYYKNLKYFYYAVPYYLEEEALKQIPDFCGLLVYNDVKYTQNYNRGAYIKKEIHTVRKPKMLFKTKWTDKNRYNLARLGTMRILRLKEKINNLK